MPAVIVRSSAVAAGLTSILNFLRKMFRDYQTIGLCQTALIRTGSSVTPSLNVAPNDWQFCTAICKEAGTLSGITQQFPHPSINDLDTIVCAQGDVTYGLKYFTVDSGTFQIIFHKS